MECQCKGSLFGLNIKHERKHFIRATIEGILYEIYSIGKTLEENRGSNGFRSMEVLPLFLSARK
jgi:glycerol kinase